MSKITSVLLILGLLSAATCSITPSSKGSLCSQSVEQVCVDYHSVVTCSDQVLQMLCTVYRMQCQRENVTPNPPCRNYCENILQSCRRGLGTLSTYYPVVNNDLCTRLPEHLCEDSSVGSVRNSTYVYECKEITRCTNITFVRNAVKQSSTGGTKTRYPYKKKHFKEGAFSYGAVVKLVKVEWRRDYTHESSSKPALNTLKQPSNLFLAYNKKVLHLQILKILFTDGHQSILNQGSSQILVVNASCTCVHLKLFESFIFLGHTSFWNNMNGSVTILPHNRHYACKISRCWKRGKKRPRDKHCKCPCGKRERRKCRKKRHSKWLTNS